MKRIFSKIFVGMALISNFLYSFCYADEIDPMFPITLTTQNQTSKDEIFSEPVEMIIVGMVIMVISLIFLYIWIKTNKTKNGEKKKTK